MIKQLAVTGSLAASMVLAAAPAHAEDWIVHITQGKDDGWGYFQKVVVADNECDSHNVRVLYYVYSINNGNVEGPYAKKDEDGCGGSAWFTDWAGTGKAILKMALQEHQNDGSWSGTGWYNVSDRV